MRSSFSLYVWLHGCGRIPSSPRWRASRWRDAAKRGTGSTARTSFLRETQNFGHPNLAVTWSLAIEEQFYLVWPLVVALTSRRTLIWICGGLIVAALASGPHSCWQDAHAILPYLLPFCRIDALAAGALVALAMHGDRIARRWRPHRLLTIARIGRAGRRRNSSGGLALRRSVRQR